MYDIHYSLTEALENYHHLISDYSVFLYIFLAISVFGILIWINRKDKISFYFTLGAALLLIVILKKTVNNKSRVKITIHIPILFILFFKLSTNITPYKCFMLFPEK